MTRFAILLGGYCAIAGLVIPAFVRPVPRLVWNASASVPVGLYAARPAKVVPRDALVAAHAPAPIARLMAARGYLPMGVPMLKQVAALPPQRICRVSNSIMIDGVAVAKARPRDRAGRPLPAWQGCHALRAGEVFLLNPDAADSFDGRYFGPVPAATIVAVLTPVWTSSAPAARQPSPQATTKE